MDQVDAPASGRRLEALRIAVGETRADFAGAVGLDPSTYAKIVRGDRVMLVQHAYALARLHGASLEYIYSGRMTDLRADLLPKVRKALREN